MSSCLRQLRREQESLRCEVQALRRGLATPRDCSIYREDPEGYAQDILGAKLTPKQAEIGRALLAPPYRVLVSSGHDVGKTFFGAVLVSWWFDTRDPSICLTTAPKLDQVKDLLWKEVRDQRRLARRSGDFTGPKSLRLETSAKHFAKGVTANSQEGFQGHHEGAVLIVIDEAEGVDRSYFEAAKTMASGAGHGIVCFYNPYSSSSHVAQEEAAQDAQGLPSWRLMAMSSLEHPNVAAELRGESPPIPQAVRLAKVQQWVEDWCQPLTGDDVKVTDVEWPPRSGKWHRPGPRFEAGVLGRRPTQAVDSVWSVSLVDSCIARQLPAAGALQIGCDVARFGDDDTAIHVKIGGASVHHEAVNGWNTVQIVARLKALACQWGERQRVDGRRVAIAVDDCGVGGGVVDLLLADGWNAFGVNVARVAPDVEKYDSLRSALWCDLADEGRRGNVSFALLSREVQMRLRRQLPGQQYRLDARGRRCCLPKDRIKSLLGKSPDDADAVNLAYCDVGRVGERIIGRVEVVQ